MLKAFGYTCGIGSMLYGAKNAGYEILGNVEWRKYYHTGTFEENFEKFMVPSIDWLTTETINSIKGADLLLGHTECGNYSNLSNTSKKSKNDEKFAAMRKNAGDIPKFIKSIKFFKPNYFAMDNLPPSLKAVPIDRYRMELPDYNIEAHLISNYHYGNIQRYRIRLFIIGWRKNVPFKFLSGEFNHGTTTFDVIGDLGETQRPEINHVPLQDHQYLTDGIIFIEHGDNLCIRDIKTAFNNLGHGKTWEYYNAQGEKKMKAGYVMTYRDKFCHTLTGRNSIFHYTGRPLTTRERARIQGINDDFIFIGKENSVDHIKQTGKCMPIQWCEYLSGLIRSYVEPDSFMKPEQWRECFYEKSPAKHKVFLGYPTEDISYYEDIRRCRIGGEDNGD